MMTPLARTIRPSRRQIDPAVALARLWQDVEAARRALARGRAPAIEHTARGLLSSLVSARVRVELAYAAASFAGALDDRPLAEEWVLFAVTARATLEACVKSGASALAFDLVDVDESFEEAREAVLLLEPEDYKEALGGTPPKKRAWWGERARLDARVREIDLERALSAIGDR